MGADDVQIEQGWGDAAAPVTEQAGWLRVTPEQPRAVVVLSAEPLRYAAHWHQPSRHFRRCSLPDTGRCVSCATAVGRQRRFVLVVLDTAGVQWAWEFGDQQAGPIQALLRGGRALRGLPLILSRVPTTAGRSPILVALGGPGEEEGPPGTNPPGDLPEPVDAQALLWATWVRQALKNGKTSRPPAPAGASSSAPFPHPAQPAPKQPANFRADYERRTGRPPRGF